MHAEMGLRRNGFTSKWFTLKWLRRAAILNGIIKRESVLLPCIPMIPTDMLLEFKRLHFPVQLAFAMIIAALLLVGGLGSVNPCFSDGQLYVPSLRGGKLSDLFVCFQLLDGIN